MQLSFLNLFYKKLASQRLNPKAISFFYLCTLTFYALGLVDNSFTKNESGLFANIALVTFFILYRQSKWNSPQSLLPLINLLITKSSVIILTPLAFIKKSNFKLKMLGLTVVSLVMVWFIYTGLLDELSGKVIMLQTPRDADGFGGRYWSNHQMFELLMKSPLVGYGIDSLNHYRSLNYAVDVFDHGGSDILQLLSSFGIFGLLFIWRMLVSFYKLHLSKVYEPDLTGAIVSFALLIKGVGLLSSFGSIFLVFVLVMKPRNYGLKN